MCRDRSTPYVVCGVPQRDGTPLGIPGNPGDTYGESRCARMQHCMCSLRDSSSLLCRDSCTLLCRRGLTATGAVPPQQANTPGVETPPRSAGESRHHCHNRDMRNNLPTFKSHWLRESSARNAHYTVGIIHGSPGLLVHPPLFTQGAYTHIFGR